MHGTARWAQWDEAMASGGTPADVLPTLSDEALVEMLRAADRRGRDYERDLLLVELGNRLARLRRAAGGRADRP